MNAASVLNNLIPYLALLSGPAAVFAYKSIAEKGLQNLLDERLEGVRAELRKDEERLKADLQAQEAELQSLRSLALGGIAARRANFDSRRALAVEQIWADAVDMQRLKFIAQMTLKLKIEVMMEISAGGGPEGIAMRDFANALLKSAGIDENWKMGGVANKERIFVPPAAWLQFEAYRTALTIAPARLLAVKAGLKPNIFKDTPEQMAPIVAALPHLKNWLEEYGTSVVGMVVDDLEAQLIQALQAALGGDDEGDLDRAHRLIRLAKAPLADQIARALATAPRTIVADAPQTAGQPEAPKAEAAEPVHVGLTFNEG